MLVIIYATDFNPLCKDGSIPVPPPTMKMAGKEEKAAFDQQNLIRKNPEVFKKSVKKIIQRYSGQQTTGNYWPNDAGIAEWKQAYKALGSQKT